MKYSVETKKKAIEYYLVGYSAQKVACLIGANEALCEFDIKAYV